MSVYLAISDLSTETLDQFRREAEHAAGQFPERPVVAALFAAVAAACKAEPGRRRGGASRFPLRLHWTLPEGPDRDVEYTLDYCIGAVATVMKVRRSATFQDRAVHNAWHNLSVSLAELRDQRRAERRAFYNLAGRLAAGGPPDAA